METFEPRGCGVCCSLVLCGIVLEPHGHVRSQSGSNGFLPSSEPDLKLFLLLRYLKAHPDWSADTVKCQQGRTKELQEKVKGKLTKGEIKAHLLPCPHQGSVHTTTCNSVQQLSPTKRAREACRFSCHVQVPVAHWQWMMRSPLMHNYMYSLSTSRDRSGPFAPNSSLILCRSLWTGYSNFYRMVYRPTTSWRC